MLSVVYVSVADPSIGEDGVALIVETARRNNARHGLTGALIYNGYNFLQLLEGPADEVEACLAIIGQDSRHSGMAEVRRRKIETRDFADWTMLYERGLAGHDEDLSRLAAKAHLDPQDEKMMNNFIALGRR